MQIGMRWPDGPPKRIRHPADKAVDVSDETAVRNLADDAELDVVTISYCPAGAKAAWAILPPAWTPEAMDSGVHSAVKPASQVDS